MCSLKSRTPALGTFPAEPQVPTSRALLLRRQPSRDAGAALCSFSSYRLSNKGNHIRTTDFCILKRYFLLPNCAWRRWLVTPAVQSSNGNLAVCGHCFFPTPLPELGRGNVTSISETKQNQFTIIVANLSIAKEINHTQIVLSPILGYPFSFVYVFGGCQFSLVLAKAPG